MTVHEFYNLIEMPDEMVKGAFDASEYVHAHMDEISPLLDKMMVLDTMESAYGELEKLLSEDHGNFKMFYCQSLCAVRIYDKYEAMGVSKEIFKETMKCFTRFAGECLVRNASYYFDRGWWTYRQISMNLLRIGTLEYEFCNFHGEDVISIHIPSDADLTHESVTASVNASKDFIKKYVPENAGRRYVCESWLLSPKLREFLPETSKIRDFQDRFDIKEVIPDNMDCLEWLFKSTDKVPFADLPENTSLQRSVKPFIINGGKLGAAFGILR